jgi:hypothetical protein
VIVVSVLRVIDNIRAADARSTFEPLKLALLFGVIE